MQTTRGAGKAQSVAPARGLAGALQ